MVAIYQAGENIYNLFDKVTVLYLGRQVYFGPAEQGKDYFVRMGWVCPSRQTTAEFLTAVTDPNGRTPRPGMENKVPKMQTSLKHTGELSRVRFASERNCSIQLRQFFRKCY